VSERGTITAPPLLDELAQVGVKLRLAEDGRLQVTAPRGRLSGDLRERIGRHKPELVEWLTRIRDDRPQEVTLPRITHDAEHLYDPFVPPDLQVSFLIGSREGSEYYVRPHTYMEFEIGEAEAGRLERALNDELTRQRKNIVIARDDLRLQTVRDPAPAHVEVHDLRRASDAERQAHCERVRAEMSRLEPAHDRWPWMDMRVSLLGDGRARLHYNHNNLFSDAPGSFGFIERVLSDCRTPSVPRPELEIGYRDCVLALAELEASPLGEVSRKYWTERLPDLPGAPEIPLAAGADPRMRSRLRRRRLVFPEPVWAALRKRAEARGLTVTTVLTAIQAEILSCWSGSRHFLINNMITHRQPMHPQMDEIFGNFASLYPLEVDWRQGGAFHERVRRLQVQIMTDVEHCHWSGVKVLQALNQERGTPGRAIAPYAIGSAFFVGKIEQPSYCVLETPQTLIDIEFWALPDDDLWVTWDVIEEMFPEGLVDAMDEGYRSLLTRLAGDDAAWETAAFDLLPDGQRERRERLNHSPSLVPAGLLHAGLPLRAAESPAAPAVIAPGTVLSYAGLHDLAGRVAALLREHGTCPGDLVAIALHKGAEQIGAVLGALTAGAAYVPLDPDWPRDRIGYVLEDTGATAVLTGEVFAGRLRALTAVPVLPVDALAASLPEPAEPAERWPGDLAYVIYTSGSTGRPKGAMLDHRGPLNTIVEINRRFGITADDVVFGVSSLCFDLSVYDVFGALEAGARLVLPAPGPADPASWVETVRAHEVTVWNSVPALMQLFTEEAEAAGVRCPSLRVVLLSGDWIPVDLPERVRAIAPNARVISLGGATEASIWSICYPIDRQDPAWTSIPYGRPLAGQTWYVLDDQGRDAPDWVPGHLYIGGAGVALGYLNDAARTEAAFVPHPRTGERLYRTGDLGRHLPDGDIEFLGRADFQVKIQGFRVEPGEIEHALLDHPAVEQAAVVARSSGSGRQLAAFVTAGRPPGVGTDALRRALAARLPAYMVPSHITVLDRLPLTSNGKLDRRSLESLAPAGEAGERGYVAPRNGTERALAAIWESILETRPIGVHDDFFDLGGQSYAAVRLIGQVSRDLGRVISLGALLESRTIAALAESLAAQRRAWSPLVRLREADPDTGRDESPWFLVHPAGGNVLCYRELAASLDRPSYAFQANEADPPQRVEDLAELYVGALVEARPQGPYVLGGWSSGAVIALEMARRLEDRGEKVERVVVVDAPAPLAPRDVDDARVLLWFLEDLDAGLDTGRIDPEQVRALDGLPGAERIAGALDLLRAAGAAEETGLDPAELARTLEVFRGVVRACNAYQATGIDADITVVRARDGSVSEFADHPYATAPDWGWSSLTTGAVRAVSVPGTHHTLLTGRHVSAVADEINGR
jgi:amino acid adenylation domain-containing protein